MTFDQYRDLLRKYPNRVGFFGVANEYTDGAVLVGFLYDDFGPKKVHAVLASKEKTFAEAMMRELGVSQEQAEARWTTWRKKHLSAK